MIGRHVVMYGCLAFAVAHKRRAHGFNLLLQSFVVIDVPELGTHCKGEKEPTTMGLMHSRSSVIVGAKTGAWSQIALIVVTVRNS